MESTRYVLGGHLWLNIAYFKLLTFGVATCLSLWFWRDFGLPEKKLKHIYNWPKKYKKICLVTIQLCIIYIFFDKYKKKIFQLVCLHVNEVYSHIWIMWPSFSFDNLNQEKIGDSKVCAGDWQLADDVIWRKKKCLKKVVTELKTGRVNWSKKSSMRSKGEIRLVGPNFLRKFSSDRFFFYFGWNFF